MTQNSNSDAVKIDQDRVDRMVRALKNAEKLTVRREKIADECLKNPNITHVTGTKAHRRLGHLYFAAGRQIEGLLVEMYEMEAQLHELGVTTDKNRRLYFSEDV